MEGMDEIEDPTFFLEETNDDLCLSILSRFSNSTKEDHQHLCSVIGAMSQELKDQNLPSSPVAYFGAACSSLDRLAFELDPPAYVVNTLLTILHLVLPRIPPAIRKKKADFLSELLVRVLRSPLLSVGAVISGLKCTSHLLNNRDAINWSDICHLYGVLLGFLTDSRPKVRHSRNEPLRIRIYSILILTASTTQSGGNLIKMFMCNSVSFKCWLLKDIEAILIKKQQFVVYHIM